MTKLRLFVDSGFFIGFKDARDSHHNKACIIWDELIDKDLISGFEDLYISDYIIVEVFHKLQKGIKFHETLKYYEELKHCKIYHLKPKDVDGAIHTKLKPFCNHKDGNPAIGLVDATNLQIMEILKIDYILSFDGGYDRIPLCKRIGNENDIKEKILCWNFD
ncbi:MAG: PIN domain-containing protein [ANME-2 cluster archaeon]|jgi:predicted nucleic acid-binding protein|nr:PIN domain-containing protein [ANME-2 cluster archaeon]